MDRKEWLNLRLEGKIRQLLLCLEITMNKSTFFYTSVLFVLFILTVSFFNLFRRASKFEDRVIALENRVKRVDLDANLQLNSHSQRGNSGDWLVWALKVEPKSLNPLSPERDIYQQWITTPNIFEPLLSYDFETAKLKPILAQSYSVSDDGLEITFTLRHDICFSDGNKLDADDVIFTFNTIRDPRVLAGSLASMFDDVVSAEKLDNLRVRFKLSRPYFKALENLSFWNVGILPKHIYSYKNPRDFVNHISNPIGSGPYVFDSWKVGRSITLKRNENYWATKPNLERIVFKFIKNDLAIVQALKAGDVDYIRLRPDQYSDLSKDKSFVSKYKMLKYWTPMSPFYYIGWNQAFDCFSDRDTRVALTQLIDRDMIVKHFQRDNAQIVTGPFSIMGSEYDKTVTPWPYDPKRALELLHKAGWSYSDSDGVLERDGKKFEFKFSYNVSESFYNKLAIYLKDSLGKVGILVVPDPVEWSVLVERVVNRDFQAVVMGWGGDILEDPYQLWHSSQIENKGSNFVGFHSEIADKLIETARITIDSNRRNDIYHKLHQLLHEQQPYTFLYCSGEFRALDRRFENVKVYPLGLNYLEWYVPRDKQKYK